MDDLTWGALLTGLVAAIAGLVWACGKLLAQATAGRN